jgi:hypothetical protein
MTDTILINNFLTREFPNDHPTIYIYVCGQKRSEKTAIEKVMSITKQIFCPPLSEFFILEIVKNFLDDKKMAYKKGEIKVKSFHDFMTD